MPSEIYRLSREVDFRERDDPRYPLPPENLHVTIPDKGVQDLRWTNPCLILGNGKFQIIGVNIYRSFDSQFSSYQKVNIVPVGSVFWRDENKNVVVIEEDVSDRFVARGDDHPEGIWALRPENTPIVKPGSQGLLADCPDDVELKIDGVVVRVQAVMGHSGDIFLNVAKGWNNETRSFIEPVLPGTDSTVTLTYRYNSVLITNQLSQRIFYKLTTVALVDGDFVETPLDKVVAHNAFEIEKLDYIWREGIRRNRWILEQGGEAVKVFIRKWVGPRCACYSDIHKQAENDCLNCFPPGTRITLSDGSVKLIEDVSVGDMVLSHTGMAQRVYDILRRHVSEPLLRLKTVYGRSIDATKEHPFFAIRREDVVCVRYSSGGHSVCNQNKRICEPGSSMGAVSWDVACEQNPVARAAFVPAKDLKKGDYLLVPRKQVEHAPEFKMRPNRALTLPPYLALPLTSISEVEYEGDVLNLEVEHDHSYVANGVAVHNCFGTSIAGGYEGPFDILIAPQDGEKSIQLTENGLNVMYQYEVWTGPSPLLNQRDFIVRQNNDRYSIGPVNVPSNRGTVLQQHFMIGYIDEKDIRYEVPANPELLTRLAFPQTRIHQDYFEPGVEGTVYPQITDIVNTGEDKVADGHQERGRTPTYGRIVR